jgi:hypothetical protein
MIYVKNVPGWERVLRALVGAAALAGGALATGGGWLGWTLGLGGAGLALSGLFGFCPACAMVGRRLDRVGR